jgi:hypothetical protein
VSLVTFRLLTDYTRYPNPTFFAKLRILVENVRSSLHRNVAAFLLCRSERQQNSTGDQSEIEAQTRKINLQIKVKSVRRMFRVFLSFGRGGQGCQPYVPAAFTPRTYPWYSFLLHCATNLQVAGSIPDGVTGILQ